MAEIDELRRRYVQIFGEEPVGGSVLAEMEEMLGVEFPGDFKRISDFYSGGLLGSISHNAIACRGAATNIVEETLRLREAVGLPANLVVIAEPSESLVVLNVDAPADSSSVIWCDAVEVAKLGAEDFDNPPDVWATYADFFDHLLTEEEEEQ